MTQYRVTLSATAILQLSRTSSRDQKKIRSGLKSLMGNPFPRKSRDDIIRLLTRDEYSLFRQRIGDYRIIYFVDGNEVKVTEIIPKSKKYHWLD
ncbi:MAG: hypothetical protein BAJATHORv1_60144 [Candidatus Thorarchaeota archaeon]|nr:MAG: hypothetical protein BAJATHORv1_60144 [Candidatus Thorarchaeota archaeon]